MTETTNEAITAALKAERSAADLNGYYEGGNGTREDYKTAQANTDAAIAVALAAVPAPTEAECTCHVTAPKTWTTYGSAVEPGSMMEPNPDCPRHFPTEADREALERWEVFSNTLAGQMSESWDGEEAQEAIIERFMKRYGALDCLIDALDYEGEVDDVVRIEFNRSTFQWSITGVAPKTQDGEARTGLEYMLLQDGDHVVPDTEGKFTYSAVSPEDTEPATPVFEAMGLPPVPPFPSIHPECGE